VDKLNIMKTWKTLAHQIMSKQTLDLFLCSTNCCYNSL